VKPLDSFQAFYGTRRFNTEFTRALQVSLSRTRPIQSTSPHSISPRLILISPTHLRLGLPSVSFPLAFTSVTYTRSSSPRSCYMPQTHLILLDLIILIILGEQYKSGSFSLCCFLHSPVTSSLFSQNILSTLFSNTLSLCSSLNARDKVSHPYRTTDKIIVLYILIIKFFDSRQKDRRFWTEW
jgi:hypothetical protein